MQTFSLDTGKRVVYQTSVDVRPHNTHDSVSQYPPRMVFLLRYVPELSSVAYHVHEVVVTRWEVERENHYLKLSQICFRVFVVPAYKAVLLDLSTLSFFVGFSEVVNVRDTLDDTPCSLRFLTAVGFNTLPIVAYASFQNHVNSRRFK